MKKSIAIATFLVVGASAAGVAALVSPYQGSDTEFNITTQAIAAAGLTPLNAYVGGGSGNAQSAMVGSSPFSAAAAKQQTGPMSRMLNNGGNICSFNGGVKGSGDTSASAIVIGLDAVAVLSAATAGGQATAACNGTADNTGSGLAYSGTTGVFAGSTAGQTWKWVLALVYGGKDSSPGGVTDCNSTARKNLIANWSTLFQGGGCTNTNTVCAASGVTGGALWHAFRRDDTSGTSDVFSSLIGISPSTSNSAVNGFGTSPYCNALNWDTNTTSNANCALANAQGPNEQFTGPGGIVDPNSKCIIAATGAEACGAAGTGNHRRPPPGTWGDVPDSSAGPTIGADVLPTQMQDNDPIRRKCIGGATGVPARAGEEVCNLDGKLGLVVPMVDSDWMLRLATPLKQYPTNPCTNWVYGQAVNVFSCAPRNTKHFGECPNGDQLNGPLCMTPIDDSVTPATSQCLASNSSIPSIILTSPFPNVDGRVYNLQMRDGTGGDGSIHYAQYQIPSLGVSVDFAAGYNRIHQSETVYGNTASVAACQLVDMTDQIGCLAQADPCSIGYAGDGATLFSSHSNPAPGGASAKPITALRVAQIAPTTTTVQLLGQAGEYQASRKLYFVSVPGFNNIAATAGDPQAADELTLAKFEASTSMNAIMTANGFFSLGPQPGTIPGGAADHAICEDFNEQTICLASANANGCTGNPTGIPTVNTVCGNGTKEIFEECDDGVNNGTAGDKCTLTCRCVNDFNEGTGVCN